jgi:hypothetical protein
MNLAEQLNQRFQKEGFPFEAEQNPECAVVKLPNGKTSDVLINNINEIDQTFNLMRTIHEMKPDLLNTCTRFDEEGFALESDGQTPYNIKAYSTDENTVIINNFIESDDKLVFTKDDVLYTSYVDLTRFQRVISDSADATSHIESTMMDARSQFETLNNEINRIHNEIAGDEDLDVPNSNKEQSTFERPVYNGPIEVESLNNWAHEQGLPIRYAENDIIPTSYDIPIVEIELYTTKGQHLNMYTVTQGDGNTQLIDNLNFINQLYGENPNYIKSASSVIKNTVITQLDMDQFAEITHEGNGQIQLSIHNRGEVYDRKHEGNKYQSVGNSVKTIATANTTLEHLKDDMSTMVITSDNTTSDLIDRYRQISDKLLGNELSVDDLNTNDETLQM